MTAAPNPARLVAELQAVTLGINLVGLDRLPEVMRDGAAPAQTQDIATMTDTNTDRGGADDELIARSLRTVQAYDAVRLLKDALSATTSRLTGYDWNADPDAVTKQQGDAFSLADKVFADLSAAVDAYPDMTDEEWEAATENCATCDGSGKVTEPARTAGAHQHSACQRDCDDCDGAGRIEHPTPQTDTDAREKVVDWSALSDLHTIKGWLHGLATNPDLNDVVADGGVTVGDCYQQEARDFAGRLDRILAALKTGDV
jgi:hypothetical protein